MQPAQSEARTWPSVNAAHIYVVRDQGPGADLMSPLDFRLLSFPRTVLRKTCEAVLVQVLPSHKARSTCARPAGISAARDPWDCSCLHHTACRRAACWTCWRHNGCACCRISWLSIGSHGASTTARQRPSRQQERSGPASEMHFALGTQRFEEPVS